MKFDKAYFLAKFAAIPDEQIGRGCNGNCALWHCGARWGVITCGEPYAETAESDALYNIFGEYPVGYILKNETIKWVGSNRTPSINDGADPAYQQSSPRARILAALNDLP